MILMAGLADEGEFISTGLRVKWPGGRKTHISTNKKRVTATMESTTAADATTPIPERFYDIASEEMITMCLKAPLFWVWFRDYKSSSLPENVTNKKKKVIKWLMEHGAMLNARDRLKSASDVKAKIMELFPESSEGVGSEAAGEGGAGAADDVGANEIARLLHVMADDDAAGALRLLKEGMTTRAELDVQLRSPWEVFTEMFNDTQNRRYE